LNKKNFWLQSARELTGPLFQQIAGLLTGRSLVRRLC